jgi:hypothetical protein
MKKLFIAAFMMLTVAAQVVAGPIITISMEFGKRPDCTGRGICKITIGGSLRTTLQINDNTGNLLLTVPKSSLTPANAEQFSGDAFEVGVDYVVPVEVCESLGIESFTIRRGNYQISESNGIYTVSFPKTVTSIR